MVRRALPVLSVLVVALLLAGCAPTRSAQMGELDSLVHRTSLARFERIRSHERHRYPHMDWSTDHCSGPLGAETVYGFGAACRRHDFAWRNLKRLHRGWGRAWTGANKRAADDRFRADLLARCAALRFPLTVGCRQTAEVMYVAVRAVPPYHSDPESRFRW